MPSIQLNMTIRRLGPICSLRSCRCSFMVSGHYRGGTWFRRQSRECFGDARWRGRAGIHPFHVGEQPRAMAEQFILVAPVEGVRQHEIGDRTLSPATNSLPCMCCFSTVAISLISRLAILRRRVNAGLPDTARMARNRHSGCSNSVAANSSQRLPGRAPRDRWKQTLGGVSFAQIEYDRYRLGEHQVAIDKHGDLAGRIDLEEFGSLVLAGLIDANGLEIHAKLLERPARADRSGRAEFIELYLHCSLLRSRSNRALGLESIAALELPSM